MRTFLAASSDVSAPVVADHASAPLDRRSALGYEGSLMTLVNKNPSVGDLRKFGCAMLLGFGVIGVVLWYVGPDPNGWSWTGVVQQQVAIVAWILGPALWLVSFGPRPVARAVYVGWMTAATYLGSVVTFVLLSVLFVVVLPIFSLIRFKDPLRLKSRASGESYWEDHTHHESTLERTIRPF